MPEHSAQTSPIAATATALTAEASPISKAKEQELQEKYRKLKRRFFELEEKHKETSTELHRSGERNSQMQQERNQLLERIMDLESQPGFVPLANGALSASPGPSTHSRSDSQNLPDAVAEDDRDADAIDAPQRVESSAARRSSRRTRANGISDDEAMADSSVMVSSTGTRMRIKSQDASTASLPRSVSPDSDDMPVDENDHSGDYSPRQKGTKRSRDHTDHNGDAGAPKSKAPRRSSRRSAASAADSTPPTSRTRVIQSPTKSPRANASPPSSRDVQEGPSQPLPALETVQETSTVTSETNNGHAEASASSSSSSPVSARPSFNPYYFLTPSGGMPPGYPYANPYTAYYIGAPMPGAPMPYMPLPPPAGPPAPRPPSEAPRPAKPKRLKAHTVTSKSYSIPVVPRDKKGKPMLPLNVGIMTVINLGDVCMREHFHTERYIFPVGYEVTRRYLSTVDRNAEVVYHCTILDGGDGPKFQIIPSDVPDRPVIAGTATGAWSSIVKQANAIRQRQHSNSVSGPDFFGLGQNTIKHLIQELSNADRLRDYVWQHFVEGGPLGGRHAAVIPALPEEYSSVVPMGSAYPPRIPQKEEGERVNHYLPHTAAQTQTPGPSVLNQHGGEGDASVVGGSRQVMPPGHASGSASGSYYLPHTQPDNGANESANGDHPPHEAAGGSTFASLVSAFPTQAQDSALESEPALAGEGGAT